jgi:hypothetical protein
MLGNAGRNARALAFALVVLFASPLARAQQVVSLQVGDQDLRFEVPDGYLQTSIAQPQLFAIASAAVPPSNRLVEGFVSDADAKRMLAGSNAEETAYQVQALRNAEPLTFSDEDWDALRPSITKSMQETDMNAIAHALSDGSAERMGGVVGMKVGLEFGDIGKPLLYHDGEDSVRFVMLVPGMVTVAGVQNRIVIECAGAILPLAGKVVFLYAYRKHGEGQDSSMSRATLDHFVERAIALNQAPAAAPAASP